MDELEGEEWVERARWIKARGLSVAILILCTVLKIIKCFASKSQKRLQLSLKFQRI
jgi:hypothetical protein